jgi:hypothetical protein
MLTEYSFLVTGRYEAYSHYAEATSQEEAAKQVAALYDGFSVVPLHTAWYNWASQLEG